MVASLETMDIEQNNFDNLNVLSRNLALVLQQFT
jgi:hypothetical protein